MSVEKLKKALKKVITKNQILDDSVDIKLYDTDATALFKNQAALVTLPKTSEEVAAIVKTINEVNQSCDQKFNFVARGAGTGLSGGAIGDENSVIISLACLDKLIEYNENERTALIEVGLVNSNLSKKTKDCGMHFSPDPSSQDACTIGGNIAENAGGIHCYKHGVTSEQILGLELITPQGDIEYLGAMNPKSKGINPCSMDFAKLFTGSEGTFGIATKALVKLQKIPESFLTMQVSLASTLNAAKIVSAIVKHGFRPTAVEMIDQGAIEAVTASFDLGLPDGTKAVLLIELDGLDDEVLLEAKQIEDMINDSVDLEYLQLTKTQDPIERKYLWKVRKGTVAAFGQIAPYWYLYDAVVPRSKIPEAMLAIEEISDRYKLKLASVCHAADGNLHPNFLYDPDKDPDVVDRIHQASTEIMQLCVDLGGTLSGEHGIGLEKREYIPKLFSENDIKMMTSIRNIFDPEKISNPGKIFPVRICKEK